MKMKRIASVVIASSLLLSPMLGFAQTAKAVDAAVGGVKLSTSVGTIAVAAGVVAAGVLGTAPGKSNNSTMGTTATTGTTG